MIRIEATATSVANIAYQHLRSAAEFSARTHESESRHLGQEYASFFEEIQTNCTATIFFSVAGLEALVNELFIAHHSRLRAALTDFDREFWGQKGIERMAGILPKYNKALALLDITPIDDDDRTYQAAYGLIQMRNALTHFKPAWDDDRRGRSEIKALLDGRFELSPFMPVTADYLTQCCMSAGCAKWAIATAFQFIRTFDRRAAIEPDKMRLFWRLEQQVCLNPSC